MEPLLQVLLLLSMVEPSQETIVRLLSLWAMVEISMKPCYIWAMVEL